MQSRPTSKKQCYKCKYNAVLPISYNAMVASGVDVAILSSIWTKAEKYLRLPNAIIEEPTDDLTKKFKVFSKSHADQPNVVIVHHNGMVHCPCLMFTTSPNLCSHAVAVAHKQGILEDFLGKVRERATSEPNLYAASTVNVNIRSAGQKGGRERRKRSNTPRSRATVTLAGNFCSTDKVSVPNASPAVTHAMNPRVFTHSTMPQVVEHSTMPQVVEHSTMPQVVAHSRTTGAVTHPTIPQVNVTHTTLPRVVAHSTTPDQAVTHPTTPQLVTHTTMPQMVTHSSMPHNFSLPQVVPYSGVKQPWHNSNLFVVMAITNRVKKCAGCPFEYSNLHGPVFTGLVVQHKEKDVYHDKEGNTRISNENNRYYHCEPACIISRHPYFTPNLLTVHEDTKLNMHQSRHLVEKFGVTVHGNE